MARRPARTLSPLEEKVMQVVWARGPSTAEDIRSVLARQAPMKDSTARTILRRLEEKGYLTHTVAGRTYVYRERVPLSRAANKAVRQVIDRLCGGSVERLLLGMVDGRMISAKQLEDLARKVAEAEEEEKKEEAQP